MPIVPIVIVPIVTQAMANSQQSFGSRAGPITILSAFTFSYATATQSKLDEIEIVECGECEETAGILSNHALMDAIGEADENVRLGQLFDRSDLRRA